MSRTNINSVTEEDRKRIEKIIRTKRLPVGFFGYLYQCGMLVPYSMLCFILYIFLTPRDSDHISWWMVIMWAIGAIVILDFKISQFGFDGVKSTLSKVEFLVLIKKLAKEENWNITRICDQMVEIEDSYEYAITDQSTKITVVYTPDEVLVNCIIDPSSMVTSKAAMWSGGRTGENKQIIIDAISDYKKQ